MATGINGTIGLLQAINATISGVVTAPSVGNYPRGEVSEMDMPMALTFVADGYGKRFAYQLEYIQRTYTIYVICFNTITGVRTEQMEATHNLMDSFLIKYLNEALLQAPSVGLNEIAIVHPQQILASGFEESLYFNGNEYMGFTITVQVHEKGTLQ